MLTAAAIGAVLALAIACAVAIDAISELITDHHRRRSARPGQPAARRPRP